MFNSTILDVLVGLLFAFLALSLIASSVTEGVSSVLGWRANTLLSGVKSLVNDPGFSSVARDLYNHGLVNPAAPGTATSESTLQTKPSYIDPHQFAGALIDVLQVAPKIGGQVQIDLTKIPDPQLRQTLQGLYDRSDQTIAGFQSGIAAWFDSSMDRLGGEYKRWIQAWTFGIGLFAAVALNVDAIHLTHALWLHPGIIERLGPQPTMNVQTAMADMNTLDLPVGWTPDAVKQIASWNSIIMVFGWLIVACATLFGAPFWFDSLQNIANLRGAGPKPD